MYGEQSPWWEQCQMASKNVPNYFLGMTRCISRATPKWNLIDIIDLDYVSEYLIMMKWDVLSKVLTVMLTLVAERVQLYCILSCWL